MDYSTLQIQDWKASEANMIVSTRIRVGRNLADYPLGPGISKEQRDEVEKIVSGVLQGLTGELAGKYYPLAGMDKKTQEQLVNDHFLFKEGDRFLEAAGLNRDWPSGRGIFHNNDKTFLVWINEEDQLRIISMQPGGDILSVFQRLATAAAEIEKVAKFAHDKHLGYITSCPTNLGTALRASVHIKLPNLAQNKKMFNEIADKYHVQIRGIHGEHTETDDGIFDISNRRRLGRSERDLVQDMYDGVKAMIKAEKLLDEGGPKCDAGPHLKTPEQITGMINFPPQAKSLLSKHLNLNIYKKYRNKKDKASVPFEQMILSGAQNVDSGIGVYAGSHDSYYTFNELFDEIIEEYHGHGKEDKHESNMNYEELDCPEFSEQEK
jgi:protein-arginine kinase